MKMNTELIAKAKATPNKIIKGKNRTAFYDAENEVMKTTLFDLVVVEDMKKCKLTITKNLMPTNTSRNFLNDTLTCLESKVLFKDDVINKDCFNLKDGWTFKFV